MNKTPTSVLFFRFLWLLYICSVVYLCFGHFNDIPRFQKTEFLGFEIDKVVHFCMFFPFSLFGFLARGKWSGSIAEAVSSILILCATACIFAGMTEIVQGMLPHRSEDVHDFAADCIAIGLSSVLVFCFDAVRLIKSGKKGKKRKR